MFNLESLIRPHILTLTPYASARDEYSGEEGIFLDANENPFGTPGLKEAFHRYPDPYQQQLKKRISIIKDVPASQIFLGNGSDEAIDLLIRAFCRPEVDNVLTFPPTYGMYHVSAHINATEVREALLTEDYHIDLDKAWQQTDKNTKIAFVCSPNNPTANLMQRESVLTVIENFPGIVVVDEAYIDFSPEGSFTEYLTRFPNLVVLQTFSKAWGMAGLRLGMAFASEEITRILNKIKPPYNVNTLTQQKALEALDHVDQKDQLVAQILEQREQLKNELEALDIVEKVCPSDANFFLVKVKQAPEVFHHLIEEKVIVRDRSKVVLCESGLRITVGTAEENHILVATLKDFGA
jgi:histidinol-phosphate aminotransferase